MKYFGRKMSKIIGIGCDLLDITRLEALFKRRNHNKFLSKVLTDKEKTNFEALFPVAKKTHFARIDKDQQKRILRWIGIRWAVKESIYKVNKLPHL